jgi:hypothetical protein
MKSKDHYVLIKPIYEIGYNFLPVKAPDWLNWVAAITLLVIGAAIIFRAIFQRI